MNYKIIFILLTIIALGSVAYIIYEESNSRNVSQPHEHSHGENDHPHGPHGEH